MSDASFFPHEKTPDASARVFFFLSRSYGLVQIGQACHDKSKAEQKKRVGTLLDPLFISFKMGFHAGFPAFCTRLDHHYGADQD